MKPALSFRQPKQPHQWQQLPSGDEILSAIEQQMNAWWPRMFGYYLLKIGALSQQVDTSDCMIKRTLGVADAESGAGVIGDIDDLPFSEHSVDVCLLNHCLEFSVDPHHIVREANRVLIPNGYLVITGYNPLSLAGLNKLIPYRRRKTPWQERFFTPMRVKDWLHLMGYEIVEDKRLLHRSLTSDKPANFISKHWQKFAEKFLPAIGSVYFIVAKKRTLPLTPIKPKWQVRPKFDPVKVPTMNNMKK